MNFKRIYIKSRRYSTLRMKSVIWLGITQEIERQFKRLKPGVVLDVGGRESPYKSKVPYLGFVTLDIDASAKPDIVANAEAIPLLDSVFDTVLCIETLEHVRNPWKVMGEINRVLKPGGVCILSTPFIHPYHPAPQDYYRFSSEALADLFKDFSYVEIIPHGNRLQMFYQFLNIRSSDSIFKALVTDFIAVFLNVLNPLVSRIKFKDNFPFGHVVYAIK